MKKQFLLSLLLVGLCPLWSAPEEWEEKTIYATSPKDEDQIVELTAFLAPEKENTLSHDTSVEIIRWDKKTMKWEVEPLALPLKIERQVADFKEQVEFQYGVEKRSRVANRYTYSEDTHKKYENHYFFRKGLGRVFLIPDFEKPVAQWKVTSPEYSTLHIQYCALEARKGKLPVFFSYETERGHEGQRVFSQSLLGMVCLKTHQLEKCGVWRMNEFNAQEGPIAWLDETHLALISCSRNRTCWAVFDIVEKKMIKEGVVDCTEEDVLFFDDFVIKKSCLYGINSSEGKMVLLYSPPPPPSSQKKGK